MAVVSRLPFSVPVTMRGNKTNLGNKKKCYEEIECQAR